MRDQHFVYADAARRVLPKFGVPANARLTLLAGAHNHVFRVDHEERRYVLRFQSEERLSDAAQLLQLEWLDSMGSDASLHVPRPIAASAGGWFVKIPIDGHRLPRRCVLLGWVDGELLSPPDAFVTGDVLERVGETVAHLHRHSCGFRSARDGDAKSVDIDDLVGQRSRIGDGTARHALSDEDHAILTAAASRVAIAMESARRMDGQYGLIHADLAPANWVFHKG